MVDPFGKVPKWGWGSVLDFDIYQLNMTVSAQLFSIFNIFQETSLIFTLVFSVDPVDQCSVPSLETRLIFTLVFSLHMSGRVSLSSCTHVRVSGVSVVYNCGPAAQCPHLHDSHDVSSCARVGVPSVLMYTSRPIRWPRVHVGVCFHAHMRRESHKH